MEKGIELMSNPVQIPYPAMLCDRGDYYPLTSIVDLAYEQEFTVVFAMRLRDPIPPYRPGEGGWTFRLKSRT